MIRTVFAVIVNPFVVSVTFLGRSPAFSSVLHAGDLFRLPAALNGHTLLDARDTNPLTAGKADAGGGGKHARRGRPRPL
jgi:hypothetical protein